MSIATSHLPNPRHNPHAGYVTFSWTSPSKLEAAVERFMRTRWIHPLYRLTCRVLNLCFNRLWGRRIAEAKSPCTLGGVFLYYPPLASEHLGRETIEARALPEELGQTWRTVGSRPRQRDAGMARSVVCDSADASFGDEVPAPPHATSTVADEPNTPSVIDARACSPTHCRHRHSAYPQHLSVHTITKALSKYERGSSCP